MSVTPRRFARAVRLSVLPLAALLPASGRAAAQTPAPGPFVTAAGTNLMLGGRPYHFIGYNVPCAQPFVLGAPPNSQANQQYYFGGIAANSGGNALRMWFFQSNGGPGNWAPFDQLIGALPSGMKIIATLVNEWPTCEPTLTDKTLPWYQTGYKQTGDGYPLSFHDFAVQVAAHYANEPKIAFWQLVNEAEAPSGPDNQLTCNESVAAQALRGFTDDMSTAIHTVDHNHLVSLGTLGGSQCGIAGTDYTYVHSGSVDLCEFHDYGDPLDPLEKSQTDGLWTRLQQCQKLPNGGKPVFIGEAGIVNNVQPTAPEPAAGSTSPPVTLDSLNLRAKLFHDKISGAFGVGVAGYDIWFKGPGFSSTGDSYSIGDGDPVEATMKQMPLTGPAPTVPETTRNLLLPISAIVVLGGGAGGVWWRRRKTATPLNQLPRGDRSG